MVMFGLDISHHQDLALDLARCKREGISFVFLKATEGAGFVDSEFAANLAEAKRAGLLVGAYHYVKGNVSAASQVAHISRVVPKDVPIIPDVEAGGGYLPLTREFVTRLRAAGYRVPLLYLPKWYWQQIGSPPMAGLPPLWSSRYPDMRVGTLPEEWADVPAHYWEGYGGLPVAVLQFTSSARIAGHQPLDANAYRGSAAQLAALLGGVVEDDVSAADVWGFENPALDDRDMRQNLVDARKAAERAVAIETESQRRMGVNQAALLAAIAADKDLDPAELGRLIDEAVKKHTPTVEQTVAALIPELSHVVRDVMGDDNTEQAEAIVDALVARLSKQEGI